jgi:tetratricopeptide (TPR) repeat protein
MKLGSMEYPAWLGSLLGTSELGELGEILPKAALQAVGQIESLRQEPMTSPGDYVHAIHDLFTGTEAWWHCADVLARQTLVSLGVAALKVAQESSQPALLSIAHTIRGKRLVACGSRTAAVASFKEALRFARRSGDRSLLAGSLIDAAHYAAGGGVDTGRELLLEAGGILDEASTVDEYPGFLRERSRFLENMGVLEFDSGNFTRAEELLRACLLQAIQDGVNPLSTLTANYLAQVLTAAGSFSEAEKLLLDVLDAHPASPRPNTFHGYYLASLGKVRLEAGVPDMAADPVIDGFAEVRMTQHASIMPIVRNYYAELLVHPAFSWRDLASAAELLAANVEECTRSGYVRSQVAAMALQARVELELGDTSGALECAEAAASLLSGAGNLPAVRSEEIYLVYYETLRASGYHARADRVLARANTILHNKAASLCRPEQRKAFLSSVGVSVSVIASSTGA